MKGHKTVAVLVDIPSNGSGVVHDFVLPCTTCSSTHMGLAFAVIGSEQVILHVLSAGVLKALANLISAFVSKEKNGAKQIM